MRIAINGFGRIGRIALRTLLEKKDLEVVAINDLSDAATLAHLFKYDSVHRRFKGTVDHTENSLIINGNTIRVFSEKEPTSLPWQLLNIDIVLESTGKFLSEEAAKQHLIAGAKQVLLSAPSTSKDIPTFVLGVNKIDLSAPIMSNASCTTNNVAPMIKILDERWGIVDGYITTIHSFTGDQSLHDSPHKDLRRARAATSSIIPTSTGAAKAITSIFPHLEGKLGGAGIRVPVPNGSLTDFTCTLKKSASIQDINLAFKQAAENSLKYILEYTEDPIVSVDILGNKHSCIFDAQLTSVVGNLVKVVGWYDNEYGYSSRIADLIEKIKNAKTRN